MDSSCFSNNQQLITIICCGKSGVGKSTIGNQILTGSPQSNLFKQGESFSEYGLTKKIQGEKKKVKDANDKCVQYLDIPGIGDPTVNYEALVQDIKNNYQNTKINIAILLINSQDNRKTLQEVQSCAFYKSFFEQNISNSKEILFLVITRWQQYQMSDQEIQMKLDALAQDGLEIDPKHVIKYRLGNNEDLKLLYERISQLDPNIGFNFKEELNVALTQYQEETDKLVGINSELRYELQAIKKEFQKVQQKNNEITKQIQNDNKKYQELKQMEKQLSDQLKNYNRLNQQHNPDVGMEKKEEKQLNQNEEKNQDSQNNCQNNKKN